MDFKPDEQSSRVGDDMALATLDPFAGIITANPATFRGFYAFASALEPVALSGSPFDDTGCRLGFAALRQTRGLDQSAVHLIQKPVIAPCIEIAPHRRDRRKVIGQHTPLAPGRRNVEDRVEHIAQTRLAWSVDGLGRGHQRRDH